MHRSQLKDKVGLKLFNGAYPQCRVVDKTIIIMHLQEI